MNSSLLHYVHCPVDAHSLVCYSAQHVGEDILSGILYCSECRRWFPIVEGIPVIYRDKDRDAREVSVLESCKHVVPKDVLAHVLPLHHTTTMHAGSIPLYHHYDASRYDQLLDSRYIRALEIDAYLHMLSAGRCDHVLELGCGSGRVTTEIVKQSRMICAIDYSMEMAQALQHKLTREELKRTLIICGDISFLPLASDVFDTACSFQVFEHLPKALRREAWAKVHTVLHDKGRLIVSVYNWSLAKRLFGKKESYREDAFGTTSDQYWYCFSAAEFHDELVEYFSILTMRGIRNIPARSIGEKLARIGLMGPTRALDVLLSRGRMGLLLGHLLVTECISVRESG